MRRILFFVVMFALVALTSSCCPPREVVYFEDEPGSDYYIPDDPLVAEEEDLTTEGEITITFSEIDSAIEGVGQEAVRKYDFASCLNDEEQASLYGVAGVDHDNKELDIKLQVRGYQIPAIRYGGVRYQPVSEDSLGLDMSFDKSFGQTFRFVLPQAAERGTITIEWTR